MSAARLLSLVVMTILFSGCTSTRNHKEAKTQNDKVSLVIIPVIVVSPNRNADNDDSSPSRDDDSHPRTLLLRNLQQTTGAEFKRHRETKDSFP
jgi:hypothetical protein